MWSENFLISKSLLKEVDPEDWCRTENITETGNSWYLTDTLSSYFSCSHWDIGPIALTCAPCLIYSHVVSPLLLFQASILYLAFLPLELCFVSKNVNNRVLVECQLPEGNCPFSRVIPLAVGGRAKAPRPPWGLFARFLLSWEAVVKEHETVQLFSHFLSRLPNRMNPFSACRRNPKSYREHMHTTLT